MIIAQTYNNNILKYANKSYIELQSWIGQGMKN